jgi:hypothetical protein
MLIMYRNNSAKTLKEPYISAAVKIIFSPPNNRTGSKT